MSTTPKLGLPLMAGSDLAATIDDTYDDALGILDDASTYQTDVFASRPSASSVPAGTFFVPSDLPGFLYLSDGTNWIEVAPGMGSVPIGSFLPYGGSSDPGDTRFAKADGRALSQSTYATLYALIGSTYNTMHGVSAPSAGQFRVPNLNGHAVIGAGSSPKAGISSRTLGGTLGAETHTLTIAEMPAHDHQGNRAAPVTSSGAANTSAAGHTNAGVFNVPGPEQGGDGAHNNMQPSVALSWLIRII